MPIKKMSEVDGETPKPKFPKTQIINKGK